LVTTSVTTRPPEQWGRECAYCHNEFQPSSKGLRAQYCSAKCRQRAYNARRRQLRREQVESGVAEPATKGKKGKPAEPPPDQHVISQVLTKHLEDMGAEHSVEGRAALTLAKRIDQYGQDESGSGLAALVRELRSSLAVVSPSPAAKPHTDREGDDDLDDIDELKRRRDHRRQG
jgi:hypothetical protein